MGKRKILFSIAYLSGGGAERVISILTDQLVHYGWKVGVLIEKATPNEYPLHEGVTVLRMSERGGYLSLKRFKERYRLVRDFDPDILMPFLLTSSVYAAINSFLLQKKWIYCVRNNPWQCVSIRERFKKMLSDFLAILSNGIMVQNNKQINYFNYFLGKKIFVVPNPVNKEIITSHKTITQINKIMTVGRLEYQKNHRMLIDAFVRVHDKYPNTQLNIYGEGSLKVELQHYIDSLNASQFISLCGRTNDIRTVYENADMFVMSSDFEGMPNALLEACTMGLPCIATDCLTGPSDIIDNGTTGLLVPIRNVERMVDAICFYIENPKIAQFMANKGQQFCIDNYSSEKVVKCFIKGLDLIY